jgi:hypothetical protein
VFDKKECGSGTRNNNIATPWPHDDTEQWEETSDGKKIW